MSEPIHTYRGQEEPSVESLSRYLAGKMTEQEQEEMEKYMEDYPMYADALEGLGMVQDSEALKRRLTQLREDARKRIYSRTPKREKVNKRRSRVEPINFPRYIGAAAAAIAALFIVFFVYDRSSRSPETMESRTIAEAQDIPAPAIADEPHIGGAIVDSLEAEKEEAPSGNSEVPELRERSNRATPVTPSVDKDARTEEEANLAQKERAMEIDEKADDASDLSETEKPTAYAPPPSPKAQVPSTEAPVPTDNLPSSSANAVPENAVLEPIPGYANAQNAGVERDESSPESERQLNREEAEEEGYKKNKVRRTPRTQADFGIDDLPEQPQEDQEFGEETKVHVMEDLLTHGLHLYDRKNYEEALHTFEEILNSDPGHAQANYYAGRSALILGRSAEAISRLDTLTADKNNIYRDAALWYQAEALFRQKKNRRALRLLRRLAKGEGLYAIKARQRLEEEE